ncbi:oligosaccharide flippase family protein [Shewanella marisflavi]|uniref:oligosaccharide flippase family protein n=1 Tax=Shewanella marisflavi TaxID=260364 RepID=UPI003AACE5EB
MNKRILIETTGRFALVTVLQVGVFFLSSNVLSVEEFGYLNILLAISFIMSNVAAFGIPNAIVYFGHESKNQLFIKRTVIYHTLFVCVISVLFFMLSRFLFKGEYDLLVLFFFSQYLFLMLNGFLQSKNEIRVLNFASVIQWVIIFFALVYIWQIDALISVSQILAIYSIGFFVPVIIFAKRIGFELDVFKRITHSKSKREFYSYGIGTFINSVVSFLNHRLDLMIVGYFLGAGNAGYYSFASQMCEKMSIFSQAYCTILFPKLVRIESDKEKSKILIKQIINLVIIISPIFTLFYFVNYFIIDYFFDDKYVYSYGIIKILIWSVFVVSVERLVFTYFSALGYVKLNAKIGVFTLLVNAVLSLFLVSINGVVGVAYATLISSILSAFLAYYYARAINEQI